MGSCSSTDTVSSGYVSQQNGHFNEFPSPALLRRANIQYINQKKPLPRTEDGSIEAYPCPCNKSAIYNPDYYGCIDDHSVRAPPDLCKKPLQELVKYLTEGVEKYEALDKNICINVGKARAIYRWIAAQHISNLPNNISVGELGTAYGYLTIENDRRKWQYTDLFVEMCRCAELRCNKIKGLVKGSRYEIGDSLCTENSESTWAAVLINNVWRLVDANFGATCIHDPNTGEWILLDNERNSRPQAITGRDVTQKFLCNGFYFLTNPEEFIYNHLPNESKWQLLSRPVTKDEFEQMAYLKQPFFEFGIGLTDCRKCVLNTNNGEANISLEMPAPYTMSYTYQLWISVKGQNENKFANIKLQRYVFLQRVDKVMQARMHFPVTGKYKIELFGENYTCLDEEEKTTHRNLCGFVINCTKTGKKFIPLPDVNVKEWGPSIRSEQAGLKPITNVTAKISMPARESIVEFEAEDDVEILPKVTGDSDVNLKNYVIHYRDGSKIVVITKVPEMGKYALQIFSKRRRHEGNHNEVCTYLLDKNTAPVDTTPFPSIPNGLLGPPTDFKDTLRLLSPSSHMKETRETALVFKFEVLTQVDLLCLLKQASNDGGNVDVSDMVMGKREGAKYTCHLRFPSPGYYLLEVYTRPSGSPDDTTYSLTTNCLVNAIKGDQNALPFPKIYTQFKDDGTLIQPLCSVLPSNKMVHFALKSPQSCDVVVNVNDELTYLSKGRDDVWKGDITTGAAGGVIKIDGRSDPGDNTYWRYTDFEVKDGVKLPLSTEEIEAKQTKKN